MCIIVYEMIGKGSIPSIKTFQVCWKEPFIIGFWTFWTFLRFYIFFNFFCSGQRQLLAKCRLLVSFWTLWNFMKLFQLFELLRWARTSPKSLLQGCRCAAPVLMALSSSLAALITLVTFVLDIVLFSITWHEFHKFGWSSQYGNAIWLTLGALATLTLRFCTSTVGIFGSYRRRCYLSY